MALLDFMNSDPDTTGSIPGASAGPDFLAGIRPAGGFFPGMGGSSDIAGTLLGAVGNSLLTSPRNNPFQNLGAGIQAANKRRDDEASRGALVAVLMKAGMSKEEAQTYALNPVAAKLAIEAQDAAKGEAASRKAMGLLSGSGLGDGSDASPAPRMTPSAPGGPAAGVTLNGTAAEKAKAVYDGLIKRGLSPVLAAGMTGNIDVESDGFNPGAIGDKGTAFGYHQARADRFDNLQAIAQAKGVDWRDHDAQLDNIAAEFGGKDAGMAKAKALIEADPNMTPQQAAALIARHGERPSAEALIASMPRRAGTAAQVFSLYGKGSAPTQVASTDPLAGFVPAPGGGADNPDPAAPRSPFGSQIPDGSVSAPSSLPRTPAPRGPVQVASNEADTQVLEGRMGMYPRSVYGITADTQPQRPPPEVVAAGETAIQRYEGSNGMMPGTGRGQNPNAVPESGQVAKADIPAPGAREAEFEIPPGRGAAPAPSVPVVPAVDLRKQQRNDAIKTISRITQALMVPNLPDNMRRVLEGQRTEAQAVLKPTEIESKLLVAGLQPGTPEYQAGARQMAGLDKADGKEDDTVAKRRAIADSEGSGLTRGTPAYANYVTFGVKPKADGSPLSVADRSAILKADEAVEAGKGVLGNLTDAMALSKQAYEGPLAAYRGQAMALLGSDAGKATVEYDNLITTNAVSQLKTIFGGNPTEGERKILLDVAGSSGMVASVREKVLQRAYAAVERRIQVMQERADEMRGGTYYKQRDGAQPGQGGQVPPRSPSQSQGQPQAPSFSPTDLEAEARRRGLIQ